MSLRIPHMDHRSAAGSNGHPSTLHLAVPGRCAAEPSDPLKFWTGHEDNTLVDLTPFSVGQEEARGGGGDWVAFSGRPELIEQLLPAIREELLEAPPVSVRACYSTFRSWWRLFDRLEANLASNGIASSPLSSVSELSDMHYALAIEAGLTRSGGFGPFFRAANTTLRALGLRPLYWKLPQDKDTEHDLPDEREANLVRHALRREWYATLDRWELAEQLLAVEGPIRLRQASPTNKLISQYRWYAEAQELFGLASPSRTQLIGEAGIDSPVPFSWVQTTILQAGFFPNGTDIRAAFYHCQAGLGWNLAVLLALDATEDIVKPHPLDPSRWMMVGDKRKGNSEHPGQGHYKSIGSPGVVILELLRRTAPLRRQLQTELDDITARLVSLGDQFTEQDRIALETRQAFLRSAVKSVWLYVSRSDGITFLNDLTHDSGTKSHTTFLGELTESVNKRLEAARQRIEERRKTTPAELHEELMKQLEMVAPIKYFPPKLFRNVYGRFHFAASGRSVLMVKHVLNHMLASTSAGYVWTKELRTQNRDRLADCMDAVFTVGIRSGNSIDHAAVSIQTESGSVTSIQLHRLDEYRELKRSRLGVGCKNPSKPAARVDPTFKTGRKRKCSVQRCMLCLENAVVLPESLEPLAMRVAEIEYLRTQMSVEAYVQSSYPEELDNTRLALQNFAEAEVQAAYSQWVKRIQQGAHVVPLFDGRLPEAA